MRDKISQCFQTLGIVIGDEENFEIQDYIEDSVSYISFIVELESAFGIEIPDDYLVPDRLKTYQDVVQMVESLT